MKMLTQIAIICALAGGAVGYMAGSAYWVEEAMIEEEKQTVIRQSPHWKWSSNKEGKSEDVALGKKNALNRLVLRLRHEMMPEDWHIELDKLKEAYGSFDFEVGREAVLILLGRWMEDDPKEAISVARRLKIWGGEQELMLHWASLDIESAAAYLKEDREMLYSGRSMMVIDYFAKMWAKKDPDVAWNWLQKEWAPTPTFLEGILEAHPSRMREFVDKFSHNYEKLFKKDRALLVGAWCRKDRTEAVRWVEGLPEEAKRENRQIVLQTIAESDRDLAEVLLNRWRDSIEESTITKISHEIKDDWDAMEWFMKNQRHGTPLPSQRITEWTRKAPDEVKKWVSNMPEGNVRELAVANYVVALSDQSYSKAMEETALFRDAERGLREMSNLMRSWTADNKEDAQKWFDNFSGNSRSKMVLRRALEEGWDDED